MKKKLLVLTTALCMAAALSACGSSDKAADTTAADTTAADTTAAAADTTAAAADTAAGGKLVMVTNAEFPPYEYHDNNEIVGIDADIAKAIAAEMGMELEIKDMAFDSLIPAVQSGKADLQRQA